MLLKKVSTNLFKFKCVYVIISFKLNNTIFQLNLILQ